MLDTTDLDSPPIPAALQAAMPCTPAMTATVAAGRHAVRRILRGEDARLLAIIGPCSIHDPLAAMDYATRLAALRTRHAATLEIVMRVFFEKPRTTIGWKGLLNDPHLDGSCDVATGLHLGRELLTRIAGLGLPTACEFLDTLTPLYLMDLVSWAAIGARTVESQPHRQMASGLPCPAGMKNATSGEISVAVDAILTAIRPHHFLSATTGGGLGVCVTAGNTDAHLVLRGGRSGPNYDAASVDKAAAQLVAAGLPPRLVIDASHGNSCKRAERQNDVAASIAARLEDKRLVGLMVESNLISGRQDTPENYGQSLTDACLGWQESEELLAGLAAAVRQFRL
jgi:3-deoxy-7-phosphoheptulonate synthase